LYTNYILKHYNLFKHKKFHHSDENSLNFQRKEKLVFLAQESIAFFACQKYSIFVHMNGGLLRKPQIYIGILVCTKIFDFWH